MAESAYPDPPVTRAQPLMTACRLELPLADRLALARSWLLGAKLNPVQLRSMGADPFQLEPSAQERMKLAVAACLRELADCLELQGIEPGLSRALLLGLDFSSDVCATFEGLKSLTINSDGSFNLVAETLAVNGCQRAAPRI